MAEHEELVVRPPLNPATFDRLDPSTIKELFLYYEKETDHHEYRYKLLIVDQHVNPSTLLEYSTAIFLIPAGRESEYIFNRGIRNVLESAKAARLIAIALGRNHSFDSVQNVGTELRFITQVIASNGSFLPRSHARLKEDSTNIPIMAYAGLGDRNVIAQGETKYSGKYAVEQVKVDNKVARRLYFLDNPFVIQSEVVINQDENQNLQLSSFEYHHTMLAGILSLIEASTEAGLMIGLGGGGLANSINYLMPSTSLTVIELDPVVVEIAQKYFGVGKEGSQLATKIGDGLKVGSLHDSALAESSESIDFAPNSLDFIVVDVDSKDREVGMSCPPIGFVDIEYIQILHTLLKLDSILAINVSARDKSVLESTFDAVRSIFPVVIMAEHSESINDKQDKDSYVNVVLFAKKQGVLESKTVLQNRIQCKLSSIPLVNTEGRQLILKCIGNWKIWKKHNGNAAVKHHKKKNNKQKGRKSRKK